MPTSTGNDTVSLTEGPKVDGANWTNQTIDGLAGYDTINVNENSTKTSYFTFSFSHDGIVTFTAASGAHNTVKFVNFEQITFWDIIIDLGAAGDDTLTGHSYAETLYGFDGNDTIDGLGGLDKMFGGAGNDTYIIDSSDVVTELAGEGNDTIKASFNFSLASANGTNVENLILTGAAAINGTGNDLNNKITGNDGNNTLTGAPGNDKLSGGKGVDTFIGGLGNDKFIVNDATEVVTELKNEGNDTVLAATSYKIGANIENLTLLGSGNFNAFGNSANNKIVGNTGNNKIVGGGGRDIMIGKAGADTFDFNKIAESAVGNQHDIIKDFVHLTDHLDVKSIDADTTTAKNQAFTFLSGDGDAFTHHAGELRFDTVSGDTIVQGDVNGDGVADFEIMLNGANALTAADFIL